MLWSVSTKNACPFSGITECGIVWRTGAGNRGLECVYIKSAPSVALPIIAEFTGRMPESEAWLVGRCGPWPAGRVRDPGESE